MCVQIEYNKCKKECIPNSLVIRCNDIKWFSQQLFSGLEAKGKILQSHCGKNKEREVLVSTSKPFTITLQSDGHFTKKGFVYQVIPEPKGKWNKLQSRIWRPDIHFTSYFLVIKNFHMIKSNWVFFQLKLFCSMTQVTQITFGCMIQQ